MQQSFLRSYVCVLCVAVLIGTQALSQKRGEWAVNLQKEYTKSYPVGHNTVALLNRYGKMQIETWDKDEVKVEAHISVGAQANEFAQRVLDCIDIKDENKDGIIRFRTEVADSGKWPENNSGGHEMRIEWVVHLPATATLYADNRFGNITIGDYKGVIELQCRYGNVTTGNLSNRKLIQVEFGKAETGVLSDSTRLVLKYSKADIEKLGGVVRADFQYCNGIDLPVDNSLRDMEIRNNYTSVYLVTPKDFSAEYDITTNHASASGKNDIIIKELIPGAPNSNIRTVNYSPTRRYAGSIGKGGGARINIKSNFGNVRFL